MRRSIRGEILKKRGGSRTMSGFCRWYEKDMEDITEHEQEQCEENGHREYSQGSS